VYVTIQLDTSQVYVVFFSAEALQGDRGFGRVLVSFNVDVSDFGPNCFEEDAKMTEQMPLRDRTR
jgi:hypothetical protein